MAETEFSHRLTAHKIVGHFFGLSDRNISGSNQVENSFFRISYISVPCPHAQLSGRAVIKKLWTFFRPWGRDLSQSPPCWIFRVKHILYIPPRLWRGRHGKCSLSVLTWILVLYRQHDINSLSASLLLNIFLSFEVGIAHAIANFK